MALRFNPLRIARCSCHWVKASANQGCVINQWCKRSLERAKQKAASKIKGTVGNIGSTIPTKPKTKAVKPNSKNNPRFNTIGLNALYRKNKSHSKSGQ
jgi:hypothetical protein